jgi:hypothetical protein
MTLLAKEHTVACPLVLRLFVVLCRPIDARWSNAQIQHLPKRVVQVHLRQLEKPPYILWHSSVTPAHGPHLQRCVEIQSERGAQVISSQDTFRIDNSALTLGNAPGKCTYGRRILATIQRKVDRGRHATSRRAGAITTRTCADVARHSLRVARGTTWSSI